MEEVAVIEEEVEKAPLIPITNHGPSSYAAKKKTFNIGTSLPCDPHRWMHRYFMLFLMCSLSFGMYLLLGWLYRDE